MTTFLLADDHPMTRYGLRAVLEAEPGWSVIGEASDATMAFEHVMSLQPDLLIMDFMLSLKMGGELLQQFNTHTIKTKVIIFSGLTDDSSVRQALQHGAMGYVLKDSDISEVIRAAHMVLAGKRYLCPAINERLIDFYLGHNGETNGINSELLTARERQVLQLAVQGFGNTEVGGRLGISPRTAETHRANILRKLHLRTQSDLVRYATRIGIVQPEQVEC